MPVRTVKASGETRDLVDALLSASRAFVAVADRSLSAYEGDVTLSQYRALVILSARGPQRVGDLAAALAVSQPNATRMCLRLSGKGLVRRSRSTADRRTVRVSVTDEGRHVVSEVGVARRAELARIVKEMDIAGTDHVIQALRAFTSAAGEVPEDGWALGWGQ